MALSPQPRYRTYTSPLHYAALLRAQIAGPAAGGDACTRLAESVATRFDAGHAVCTSQARMAIYFAVKKLVRPGRKIVLSPYTIADVINVVIAAGAVPVFCDIERETCNIDASKIEALIDEQTDAVMVTHLHGLACDLDAIEEICRRRQVHLIEDAAQAFGTIYRGRRCGTVGAAGVYSFGLYKNLTAIFGGMLVSRDESMIEQVEAELATYPYFETSRLLKKGLSALATDMATSPGIFQSAVFPVFRFGHLHQVQAINRFVETELDLSRKNALPEEYFRRMTPAQAELALAGIDRVDPETKTRVSYARRYHEGLRDIPELLLPPLREDGSHLYTYFPVQGPDRAVLLRHLMANHRDVGRQHLKNTADLPAFTDHYRDCPNARATAGTCVLLPTYPRYGAAEVDRTIGTIRSLFGR